MSNPYDYEIDPQGNTTANKVLAMVGEGCRVLELGTAAGVMTRELQRRGCRVTGIEYVPEMAEVAAQWCERIIVADLDSFDFAAHCQADDFDVVVAADVLEHLRDPAGVLRRLRAALSPRVALVISVPNVGYAGLLAELMQGRFRYREKGLLDGTHLRHFTRDSLEWMLLETGWLPQCWDANRLDMHHSEFGSSWFALDATERTRLAAAPDADVYQYLVRAVAAGEPGHLARLQAALSEAEEALRAEQAAHQETRDSLAALEAQREGELADLREHRKAFAEARGIIAQQSEQLQAQAAQLERLRVQLPLQAGELPPSAAGFKQSLARGLYRVALRLLRR